VPLLMRRPMRQLTTSARVGNVMLVARRDSVVALFYTRLLSAVFGVLYPWVWFCTGTEPFRWLLGCITTSQMASAERACRSATLTSMRAVSPGRRDGHVSPAAVVACSLLAGLHVDRRQGRAGAGLYLPHGAPAAPRPRLRCLETVSWRQGVPTIIVRKYYHLLAVVIFMPGVLWEARRCRQRRACLTAAPRLGSRVSCPWRSPPRCWSSCFSSCSASDVCRRSVRTRTLTQNNKCSTFAG
jgi:hypothetical protein